jgi:PAS domain S-box-containing protein
MPVARSDRPAASPVRELGAWSVSNYLVAFGIALIAPALILGGLIFHRFVTAERAHLEQRALEIARSIRADIDQELIESLVALEALAASPMLTAGDLAGFYTHAKTLVETRPAQYIVLSRPSGEPLMNTRVAWGDPLPAGDNPAALQQVLETGRFFVSDVFSGADSSGPYVNITVPVVRDGAIASLLSYTIAVGRLADLVRRPRVPFNWDAAVLDRQGSVIASTAQKDTVPVLSWKLADTRRPQEGASYFADTSGRDVLTGYAGSRLTGWLIAAVPRQDMWSIPSGSWRTYAVAGGALLASSFLIALYLATRVARPLRLTALAAAALGRGESMPQLPAAIREVDEVLRALKAASLDRRLAEERLRAAHERMTLALSATQMGMWERDLTTNRVTWSEAMYEIFGRSPEEFSGDPDQVLSFVHPDDRLAFRQVYQAAVEGGNSTFEHESRIVRPNGEIRWLYRRAFIRRDVQGRATSVLGVALDVTERKEAEHANAQLAAIVASSSEAILSVSLDGTITTWNGGAERTFGYGAGEAIGMPLARLFEKDQEHDLEAILEAMRAGEIVRLETLCRRAEGERFEVHIVVNPVASYAGAPCPSPVPTPRCSVTIRDISDRKNRERHLANVLRELTHRSKNLLAIVQAMARQTAIRSESLLDFESRFSGRLQSLSRSHELLIGNDWEGGLLSELVRLQKGTFGPRQLRIDASGPEVFLRPEAIVNVGLAIHEFASNAERHGALSLPSGQVELRWWLEQRGPQETVLLLVWSERGGPSSMDAVRRGFGRDIVEHVVPTALGAKAALVTNSEGLQWLLEIPSQQLVLSPRASIAA